MVLLTLAKIVMFVLYMTLLKKRIRPITVTIIPEQKLDVLKPKRIYSNVKIIEN